MLQTASTVSTKAQEGEYLTIPDHVEGTYTWMTTGLAQAQVGSIDITLVGCIQARPPHR